MDIETVNLSTKFIENTCDKKYLSVTNIEDYSSCSYISKPYSVKKSFTNSS